MPQPAPAPDPRRVEFRPISSIKVNPRNPKAHADELIDGSIGRFGLLDLITLDERTDQIVSGHGRLDALLARRDRGESPPEGIRVDADGEWLVPVVAGWASRTDTEATAALIALNRTTELGGWVDETLLDLLDELVEQDPEGGSALVGVGFGGEDIDALRQRLADFAIEEDGEEEPDEQEPAGISEGRGLLLSIADLSVGEPSHEVHRGQVWAVGRHVLAVVNPHTGWPVYLPYLRDDVVLAPYPDIYLPMTDIAKNARLVLVQPNLYLAGHLLDKFATVYPNETVERIDAP